MQSLRGHEMSPNSLCGSLSRLCAGSYTEAHEMCVSPPLECTRADSVDPVRDRGGATNSVVSEVASKLWESEKRQTQGDFDFGGEIGNHCVRTVTAEFPGLGGRGEGDGCEGRLSAPGAGWAREG